MEVTICVWKANKDQLQLVNKILAVIQKETKTNLEFNIQDMWSTECDQEDTNPQITFGNMAKNNSSQKAGRAWALPSLSRLENNPENRDTRLSVFNILNEIACELDRYQEQINEPTKVYVETEDITVGIGVGEIQLTETERDSLLKIKELLGGGKMVITKGDIKIEVE